jgi:UDP-N-acetylglucosamine 3-dehydrogenase
MLKAAVIGAGAMGRNHARVYAELDRVELAAVADVDRQALESVGRRFGVRCYEDYREMLDRERPDLVSVAVPTALHRTVALGVVERGINLLIEKPIAATSAQAREVVAAATKAGVKLAVGHVERFNPAVIELKRCLAAGELGQVFAVHSRRLSPFPARITDVGVVLDLATHELDILCYLLDARVVSVYAELDRRIHPAHEDMLLGLLRFDNGVLGILDVSWLSPVKRRELFLTGARGMYQVNYLTQDLYFYENGLQLRPDRQGWDVLSNLVGVTEGSVIRLALEYKEPLRAELEAFARAVETDTEPPVGWREGYQALRLAELLLEAGRLDRIISLEESMEVAG